MAKLMEDSSVPSFAGDSGQMTSAQRIKRALSHGREERISKNTSNKIMLGVFRAAAAITTLVLIAIIAYVVVNGLPHISLDFIFGWPEGVNAEGGIWPTIVSTVYVTALGVLFFTFIFVIQLLPELFKLILNNGAPIWTSLEIFVYMLPFNVAITIPMSILMAGIMGYGRLSSDNEIIVMRALGFSHMRIYAPIIILGFFTFLFSLFFNNVVMTESNYRYRALFSYIINIRPSIAVGKLEFAYISDINLSIGAYYSDNDGMSNVVIYDGNSQARRIITAKNGKWKNNEANSKVITLTLYDGIVQEMPVYGFVSNDFTVFDAMDINIVRNVSKLNDHERGLREIPAWEIRKKINTSMNDSLMALTNQISNMISTAYSNSFITNIDGTTNIILTNANVSFSSFSNTYVTTNSVELDKLFKTTKKEAVPYFYYVEFHKFISIPAACLFMVFIGAPLGIVGKRSGRGFGFGLSVIVVVIYYILITVAEIIAGNRKVPGFVAMWFPNIVLAVIGGFLMIRSFFSKGK